MGSHDLDDWQQQEEPPPHPQQLVCLLVMTNPQLDTPCNHVSPGLSAFDQSLPLRISENKSMCTVHSSVCSQNQLQVA